LWGHRPGYDKPENGGNNDGFIDPHGAIYSKLSIWIDANHDGISQPNELHSLSELGIGRIELQYQVCPRRFKRAAVSPV